MMSFWIALIASKIKFWGLSNILQCSSYHTS
jgi:hypothetical protein